MIVCDRGVRFGITPHPSSLKIEDILSQDQRTRNGRRHFSSELRIIRLRVRMAGYEGALLGSGLSAAKIGQTVIPSAAL